MIVTSEVLESFSPSSQKCMCLKQQGSHSGFIGHFANFCKNELLPLPPLDGPLLENWGHHRIQHQKLSTGGQFHADSINRLSVNEKNLTSRRGRPLLEASHFLNFNLLLNDWGYQHEIDLQ